MSASILPGIRLDGAAVSQAKARNRGLEQAVIEVRFLAAQLKANSAPSADSVSGFEEACQALGTELQLRYELPVVVEPERHGEIIRGLRDAKMFLNEAEKSQFEDYIRTQTGQPAKALQHIQANTLGEAAHQLFEAKAADGETHAVLWGHNSNTPEALIVHSHDMNEQQALARFDAYRTGVSLKGGAPSHTIISRAIDHLSEDAQIHRLRESAERILEGGRQTRCFSPQDGLFDALAPQLRAGPLLDWNKGQIRNFTRFYVLSGYQMEAKDRGENLSPREASLAALVRVEQVLDHPYVPASKDPESSHPKGIYPDSRAEFERVVGELREELLPQ